MTPTQEGAKAAREGIPIQHCPYSYSQMEPPMDMLEYIASGNQYKCNAWMTGWYQATAKMGIANDNPPSEGPYAPPARPTPDLP